MIFKIKPFQKDHALLHDIRQASSNPAVFHAWWLGQSGFLIKWGERFLLLDPYLSDSLTNKYAQTNKPHVRMTERAIDPARLDFIRVVTSSHNHTDHLDGETLLPLMQANPGISMLIPEANRAFVVKRLGCEMDFPIGINDGQVLEIQDFTFHAVPAAHEGMRNAEYGIQNHLPAIGRDEQGRCHCLGYVVRFGEFSIYHSGDTMLFEGMTELLRPFNVDVAFLPINGADPGRGVAGNLDCREAAHLGKAIGAKLVVPCHYDMFEFNTADPADFVEAAEKLDLNYRVMRCGEGITVGKKSNFVQEIFRKSSPEPTI